MDTQKVKQAFQKILLVEDDPSIREVLSMLMKMLKINHLVATDGAEAIEMLKLEKIDVLMTDFRMPKVDGIELLQWCRTNDHHFPVIFLSANAELVDKEKIALQDCCATLMRKPINLNALEEALESALELRHHANCVHSRDTPV